MSAASAAWPGGAGGRPLVGREPELAALEAALQRAREGRAAVVLCIGEAGIGKTRLTSEFAARAEAGGAVVLRGGALDVGEGGLPFGAIVESLRRGQAAGRLPVEVLPGPLRDELRALLPNDVELGAAAVAPHDAFARVRLFEAILRLFARIAERAPLVVLIEDLHWADRSTLDLLGFVIHNLATEPAVFVLTQRPAGDQRGLALRAWVAELARRSDVERLEVAPLDRREAESLVNALAGGRLPAAATALIIDRAGGNPFAIEELAAMAIEGDTAAVPPAIRDSILAALATVKPGARSAAGAAAVLGGNVDAALLAEVGGMPNGEVSRALRELVDARILGAHPATGELAFRHDLTREAIAADLLAVERRDLHARAANALAARLTTWGREPGGKATLAARVAEHRAAAGETDEAFRAFIDAADAAEAVLAFAEAAGYLERALATLDGPSGPVATANERADLATRAADNWALAGDAERASQLVRQALRWLGPRAPRLRRGLLWERLADYGFYTPEPGRLEAAQMAVRLLPSSAPTGARARAFVALVEQLEVHGRHGAARRAAARSVAVAREGGWPDYEAVARANLSFIVDMASIADAVEACREGIRIGLQARSHDVVGRSYVNLQFCHMLQARFADAVAVTNDGLDVARRIGLGALIRIQLAVNGADALTHLGRLDEADALALSTPGEISGIVESLRQPSLAVTAGLRGDLDSPAARLDVVAAGSEALAGQLHDWVRTIAADLALARNDVAEARSHVDAVLASQAPPLLRHTSQAQAARTGLALEARVLAAARVSGDQEAIRMAVERGRRLMGFLDRARKEVPREARIVHLYLATAVAEGSRLSAPNPDAWAAAAAGWADADARYWLAYCWLGQAEALLATGRRRATPTEVADLVRAAHAAAAAIGARLLHAEAVALAARARIALEARPPDADVGGPARPASDRPDPRAGLSARELEILVLVAQGLTNRQIGEALFISPKTAGVHVSNILGKLRASNRLEAATIGRRAGLVS